MCVALSAFIKKLVSSHTTISAAHLKALEQKEIITQEEKEIIKLRAEINKIETKRTTQRINETNSWLFEKINKIDKPLSKLSKRQQRENIQISKL
jgi:argininosuccinate lyase